MIKMVNPAGALRVGAVVFPSFTAMDLYGPLQALNLLAWTHPFSIEYVGVTLDPVSADRQILNGIPVGSTANAVSPFFTEWLTPTVTLDNAPEFDILFVPGGNGTGNFTTTQPIVDWLSDRLEDEDGTLKYLWTVCTGSLLTARTGKLDGKKATTNKMAWDLTRTMEGVQGVDWVPKARWVVDGKYWTSSGVSAGVDMILGWIGEVYGEKESERVRVWMEWNSLNQTEDPFAIGLE